MSGFKKGKDREEKIDIFLDNLAWFHSTKAMGDSTASQIRQLNENLIETTKIVIDANKSSDKLAKSLNYISIAIAFGTVVMAIVAALDTYLTYFQ